MSRRAAGLRWERISDAVRDFIRQHGGSPPRRAVLCTYDFDPKHFHAMLFPALTRRAREFRTLILADAGSLQQSFGSPGQRTFARYELAPVRCLKGGVFHPKIMFLQAGRSYLVGIGSSNLTRGGFGGNLELMLFADQSGPEGKLLIQGVASFFHRLIASKNVAVPQTTCRFVRKILTGLEPLRNVVLDSLEAPLLEQMVQAHRKAGGGAARAFHIVSPWHSSGASPDGTDPKVIAEIRRRFGVDGRIRAYTQGHGGVGPDLGDGIDVQILQETTLAATPDSPEAEEEAAHDHRPTQLHAKAYLIRGSGKGTLFFGSANCTQPALTRSVPRKGNVEVLVGVRLKEADMRAIEKDLEQLFRPAEKKCAAKPQQRPSVPRGVILAGHVAASAGRTVLRVEAPSVNGRTITIASTPRLPGSVNVSITKGIGEVREERLLQLFSDGGPDRQADSWCCVLWEKTQSNWVPFPVLVPLTEPTSAQPDEALYELLEEECGWWPSRKTDTNEDRTEVWTGENGAAEDADDTETEKDAWTKANHQGELDRIAVAAALLRRRVLKQFETPASRRAYFRLLQEQIDSLQLAPHLVTILRKFFKE